MLLATAVLTTGASQTAVANVNMGSMRTTNGPASQDVSCDPYSDPRLRNSGVSLEEKGRAMSNSGSFRDGLEEGKKPKWRSSGGGAGGSSGGCSKKVVKREIWAS